MSKEVEMKIFVQGQKNYLRSKSKKNRRSKNFQSRSKNFKTKFSFKIKKVQKKIFIQNKKGSKNYLRSNSKKNENQKNSKKIFKINKVQKFYSRSKKNQN